MGVEKPHERVVNHTLVPFFARVDGRKINKPTTRLVAVLYACALSPEIKPNRIDARAVVPIDRSGIESTSLFASRINHNHVRIDHDARRAHRPANDDDAENHHPSRRHPARVVDDGGG